MSHMFIFARINENFLSGLVVFHFEVFAFVGRVQFLFLFFFLIKIIFFFLMKDLDL